MGVEHTHIFASRRALGLCLGALLVLMVGLAGCGSDDTAAVQSCDFHSECPLGTSCNFENKCVAASCEDCANDSSLVCLETDEHPEGVCSRPECTADDECDTAAGETCEGGICVADGGGDSCQSDGDCDPGESCNLQNECVPDASSCTDSTDCADDEICDDNNECVPDSTDPCGGCATGEVCNTDTNQCEPEQSCDPACGADETCNTATGQCEPNTTEPCGGSCPSGEVCNTSTDQCEPEQSCDPACGEDEYCDTATGQCEENTCPPGTPDQSDCTGQYDKFNPDGCFCAQCLSDSDCDTAAGETCNNNGECMVCNESCDPADGASACGDPGYYCVSDCCVECLGAADCSNGEVCVDGSCGAPPDCSVDPSVCTGGTVCDQATQTCVPPQTGQGCSTDADCPDPTSFCNPQTSQCESIMGPGGGATCDPACPSGTTCQLGMFCSGCTSSSDCPSGNACLEGTCFDCSILGPEFALICQFL